MDVILSDIRAVAESIFLGGDWTYLGMVAVAIVLALFAMRNFGQILCASLMAMVLLGVVWIAYGGATSEAPSDPATWLGQLEAGWASIAEISGTTMVGYLVTFAVALAVLGLGRSLLFRG